MEFNIYFILRGPAGQTEFPNSTNPVEVNSLKQALKVLSFNIPDNFFEAKVVGVRIEEVV